MKTCFKCGISKELSEFYTHSEMADGHVNKCIVCNKKDVMQHREKNIERIRQYDLDRAKLPHRKQAMVNITSKYKKEHINRNLANQTIARAIKMGLIIRPSICSICGKTCRPFAHHPDYTKPLEVVFVCQPCHKEIHKTFKSAI